MKSVTKSFALISSVLIVALGAQTFRMSAQSGRRIPPPQPPPESPKPDVPVFVPDPNGDEYKFVFPQGYEDKLLFNNYTKGSNETKALKESIGVYLRRRLTENDTSFINQFNDLGAQGYRLVSTMVFPGVAIFRRDKIQYEYSLFETTSSLSLADEEFKDRYAPLAKKGFRVAAYFYLYDNCITSTKTHVEICNYHRLYLVERKKQSPSPQDFALVYHRHSYRSQKVTDGITEQLNESLGLGLFPTDVLTDNEVLVQAIDSKEGFSPDKYELQYVNKGIRHIKDGINELAQQGYRLAVTPFYTAVMSRVKGETTPASYVWINWDKTNIEQEITKLQEQGAIYRTTFPHLGGPENEMIFEQPRAEDAKTSKRREYRVLTIELQTTLNSGRQRVEFDLTPASKESVKMLNELAKEGFEARDLFRSPRTDDERIILSPIRILLERTK